MQATKSQSPQSKKNNVASAQSGTIANNGQISIKTVNDKSLAQRVMDVTLAKSNSSTCNQTASNNDDSVENINDIIQVTTTTTASNSNHSTRPILKQPSTSYNISTSDNIDINQQQTDLLTNKKSMPIHKEINSQNDSAVLKQNTADQQNIRPLVNETPAVTLQTASIKAQVDNTITAQQQLSVSSHSSQSLLVDSNDASLTQPGLVQQHLATSITASKQLNQKSNNSGNNNNNNSNNTNSSHNNNNNMNTKQSTTRSTTNGVNNSDHLISCQSIFKQVINKNMKPPSGPDNSCPTSGGGSQQIGNVDKTSSCVRATRVSLDTRIPHPSRHNGFHSEEEEVSYLNLGTHNVNHRAACSSLDNTTKPILLAAAREQRLGLHALKSTASSQQLRPKPIQLQQRQFNEPPQATVNTSSGHEYEGMTSDYDEYDTRYDNALVEKRIRQKQIETERQTLKTNSQNNNNENNNALVESLYDCSTANDVSDVKQANSGQQKQQQQESSNQNENCLSTPASPKAKSAPATPCNMTPTAFHQHNPEQAGSFRGATIGGQVCVSSNTKDACFVPINKQTTAAAASGGVSKSNGTPQTVVSLQDLDELAKRGEHALEAKDYPTAVIAFSHCIELASQHQNIAYLKDFQIYCKRAEAQLELKNYNLAIEDSIAARELNHKWAQAYYLEGRAKLLIGEPLNSLPVFAYGLAQDPSNVQLFEALIDAALKSCYNQDIEPKLQKLRSLNLDRKPFVVVSMIGQEILAKGEHNKHAAVILESALKLESSDDKKIKSSVLSTVALAFSLLKDYDKAIAYMQRELCVENELEDVAAQCRVLSNLGFMYYKLRKFDKSLEAHRKQLNLAMKSNLFQQASMALDAVGHVHVARNDFPDALTSHSRCLDILRQLADNEFAQFKELLSIGHVCSMMNDLKTAEERYREAAQFLDSNQSKLSREEYRIGCVMHRFNMAHVALKKQNFRAAERLYDEVIHFACELSKSNPGLSALYQMRAYNGMGHTFRLFRRFAEARSWFERQLKLAASLRDLEGQSQALCNLGMTCQHFKDYNQAQLYFDENLKLVDRNPLLRAYALSYLGSVHFLLGHYNEAQVNYENSLSIFKELDYCSAERKTIELNMAFVQERVGIQDMNYMDSPSNQAPTVNAGPLKSSTSHKKTMTAS